MWQIVLPRVWQIMLLHAWECGEKCSVCMPLWQIVRLHACLCSTINLWSKMCNCMHTCVTDYANVFMPVWQTQVGCKMWDDMHTCVADYANANMAVWQMHHL